MSLNYNPVQHNYYDNHGNFQNVTIHVARVGLAGDVCQELVAFLKPYVVFKRRDGLLRKSLRSYALEWAKQQHLPHHILSGFIACSITYAMAYGPDEREANKLAAAFDFSDLAFTYTPDGTRLDSSTHFRSLISSGRRRFDDYSDNLLSYVRMPEQRDLPNK
jgi:hypothetical protein